MLKRLLSLCLAFLLMFSSSSVSALAAERGAEQMLVAQNSAPMDEGGFFNLQKLTLKSLPQVAIDARLITDIQATAKNLDLSHLAIGKLVDPTQYLQLAALTGNNAFGIGEMSIQSIANLSNSNISNLALSQLGNVIAIQTPTTLIQSIPSLGDMNISQIKPVYDLVSKFTNGGVVQGTLSEVVKNVPGVANIPLSNLGVGGLAKYGLSSIPGLSSTALGDIANLDGALVKDLTTIGLDKIPLGLFPRPPTLIPEARLGMLDIVLGEKEQNRLRSVSGTTPTKDDKFTAATCPGNKCPHIEITDRTTGQYSGYAWMDGNQKAKDGFGPLCLPFGCKGSVGSHPFGKAFRIVLSKADEKNGEIRVGMKFRVCKKIPFYGKTCTPYLLPPTDVGIPLGKIKEKSAIAFVPPGAVVSGEDYTPPGLAGTDAIAGSDGSCSGSLPIDLQHLDAVTQAVINATPAEYGERNRAAQYIPYIMRSCAKAGLTDSAQLAYALATAEHETDHFRTMQEEDTSAYDECGVGEGMIQVTHCQEKTKIMKRLGMTYGGSSDKRLQNFDTAADALCVGLKEGVYGQGQPIAECFAGGQANYTCARQQVNDHDKIEQIADYARSYQAALQTARATPTNATSTPVANSTGASTCSVSAPASGSVNDRVLKTAIANQGKIDQCGLALTDYGRNGCMYAVDTILQRAGLPMFGGSQPATNITSAEAGCKNGSRGTLINASDAKAGDILIMDDGVAEGHIGICTSDGCKTTLSNSTGRCNFVWESDGCFSESYGCSPKFTRYLCRVKG